MFSQSLFAQIMRMTVLLALSLVIVHHSPALLRVLAEQAVNSGCHQTSGDMDHSHHHH
ncbi:hypothetical protein J4N42_15065 [Vibrio sp. SCSIO 43135]|uniref:Uncharacterized protein n=1 Tax=Vibrio paucivorans TaxID=2829489 RepID=A0A9X3HS62_9VIBR|nr:MULTISPECIES: hypothetical protein [Vibrio]MCW8333987.1 hypothetical protein [Vibrio paucivorans]USD43497.1 hypothetical protein J4N42_15065 [Vibrio sp. SCSIO 43135]